MAAAARGDAKRVRSLLKKDATSGGDDGNNQDAPATINKVRGSRLIQTITTAFCGQH